jgi:hypothetical protein
LKRNRPALSTLADSFKRGRPFADVPAGEGEEGGKRGKADEEEEEELKDVHGLRAALIELRAICLGPQLVRGWRYSGTCGLTPTTSPLPYFPTFLSPSVLQFFSSSFFSFIIFNEVYFKFS